MSGVTFNRFLLLFTFLFGGFLWGFFFCFSKPKFIFILYCEYLGNCLAQFSYSRGVLNGATCSDHGFQPSQLCPEFSELLGAFFRGHAAKLTELRAELARLKT